MQHHWFSLALLVVLAALAVFSFSCTSSSQTPAPIQLETGPTTPLASWNETEAKIRVLEFVTDVTNEASPRFVPPERRVATFDLDGTLIVERPDYIEVLVAVEDLRGELAGDPSLSTDEPWRAVARNDVNYWRQNADSVLLAAAQGDRLTDYHHQVTHFLQTTNHPQLHKTYASLLYLPMVELIELLRSHGFLIYLVSASQQEYMRAFATACLGVNPRQVVGSMIAFEFSANTARGFTRANQWWQPMSDGDGKAERIHERIAVSPIFAAGNSSGDREMLEMTAAGDPSLVLLLDHDDATREFEYHQDKILAAARQDDWLVVSMKNDWARMFGHRCSW